MNCYQYIKIAECRNDDSEVLSESQSLLGQVYGRFFLLIYSLSNDQLEINSTEKCCHYPLDTGHARPKTHPRLINIIRHDYTNLLTFVYFKSIIKESFFFKTKIRQVSLKSSEDNSRVSAGSRKKPLDCRQLT